MRDKYGNRNGYGQIAGDAPAFPVGNEANGIVGMSLRDYFAAQAISEMIRAERNHYPSPDYSAARIATWCYQVADAMIEARKA